jgi:predicted amidohydrolase YtcJ
MRADVVLRGGSVYTMDRRQPRAKHVAVGGGRILACSVDDPFEDLVDPATRVIDVNGRAVVPGFVDAHIHFGKFALGREQVDLDAAATLSEGQAILREASRTFEAGAWVLGRGWDRNRWGRLPAAADLDGAVGDRCAALSSHDGHSLWLSSKALQQAGIDRNTPDPQGGVIQRDEAGEPAGVLFENAQDLVRAHIPEPTDRQLSEAIRGSLGVAAAAGLTGIHNLEEARTRRVFQAIEAAGELTLRVYHGVPRGELREAVKRGLQTGAGSDWLRIGPVKLFSDGALGSRTAHLLEPYVGREDSYRGVPTMTGDELREGMRCAADAGLDLAVHAIGDAAVRSVLDAFEQTRSAYPPLRQRMLRIEHAQLIDPADMPRFTPLGVVASMQPIHATADRHTADAQWGERCHHAYPWRDVLDSGAVLAFGTDAPVEAIEPLKGLYAAVTRDGWFPEQCLSLEEAVRAYTLGSAAAERAAGRRGTLAPGMDADLVVLSRDPFVLEPAALCETGIDLTMVCGRITFGGVQ